MANNDDDKIQRVRELNDELRDMQQKVIRSLWQVVPCLGPFYGIFVFDIIGDASSMMKHAIFAPVLLLVTGVVIYLMPYLQDVDSLKPKLIKFEVSFDDSDGHCENSDDEADETMNN